MRKVAKKRFLKISLAILVLVVIILGLSAILERDWGRLRGLEFLGSPDLVVQKTRGTARSATKATYYYYYYKADFNGVSAKADTGLFISAEDDMLPCAGSGLEGVRIVFRFDPGLCAATVNM